MFERIKCYRRLTKMEKQLRGCVRLGEMLDDEQIIEDSMEALRLSAIIKRQIWTNRTMAKKTNLEFEMRGFF